MLWILTPEVTMQQPSGFCVRWPNRPTLKLSITLYDNGQGVPQGDAEAVRWYRKAADLATVEQEILRRVI